VVVVGVVVVVFPFPLVDPENMKNPNVTPINKTIMTAAAMVLLLVDSFCARGTSKQFTLDFHTLKTTQKSFSCLPFYGYLEVWLEVPVYALVSSLDTIEQNS
jgi:hypothetical protein